MSMPKQPKVNNAAEQIAVRDAGGVRVAGWAVRPDAVLVQASGLKRPLSAKVDKAWVQADAVHEAKDGSDRWTLLELPAGSVKVDGSPMPPVLPQGLTASDSSVSVGTMAALGSGVPIWCRIFPKMKGCR